MGVVTKEGVNKGVLNKGAACSFSKFVMWLLFTTLNVPRHPAQSNCAANSHSTMMRLDIYEQQEAATGAKQITSSKVGWMGRQLFCLLVFVSHGWGHQCPVSALCSLFVCMCARHPCSSPIWTTTTSCVVVRNNGNMTSLPPQRTAPTSAPWILTRYAVRHLVMMMMMMIHIWRIYLHHYWDSKWTKGKKALSSMKCPTLPVSSVCFSN